MRYVFFALALLALIAAAPVIAEAHGGRDNGGCHAEQHGEHEGDQGSCGDQDKGHEGDHDNDNDKDHEGDNEGHDKDCDDDDNCDTGNSTTPTPAPEIEATATPSVQHTASSSTTTSPEVLGAQHGPTAAQPAALPQTGGRP